MALTDVSGNIQTTYTYGPFGQTAVAGTSNDNPYQFQGREAEPMNGLFGGMYYYRARFLDTGLSRFVSRDPAGFQGGGHLYNYGGNAPTMSSDPTGMEDFSLSGLGLTVYTDVGGLGSGFAQSADAGGGGSSGPTGTAPNGGEDTGGEPGAGGGLGYGSIDDYMAQTGFDESLAVQLTGYTPSITATPNVTPTPGFILPTPSFRYQPSAQPTPFLRLPPIPSPAPRPDFPMPSASPPNASPEPMPTPEAPFFRPSPWSEPAG